MSRARFRPRALRLAPLLAAFLLSGAAQQPDDLIRVKGIGADTTVAVVASDAGALVRLDVMARLLGGGLDSAGVGVWRFTIYGTSLDVFEGLPFVGYNGFVLPVSEPTRVVQGAPHVSLQLFSEILPRFGIGVLWDRTRSEVQLFQSIARVPASAPARTPAPATTPVLPTAAPAAPNGGETSGTRTAPAGPPRLPNGLTRRYTVAVDAGHGGKDPGNPGVVINGRRVNESKLTLAISLELERALKARGVDVVMTRSTDTLIARDDRGPIANAKKSDLFVSIHTNAANPAWRNAAGVRGFETYFLATARTEDERRVAAMENDVVRFESEADISKGDPLAFILNDLAQNEHLRESSDLAGLIQARLANSHPGPNRGVKQAGFAVLSRAYMPAVLVEVGYGSNALEARWMAQTAGQRAIATEIADAVIEYLQHYERRARAAIR
jgi:N-acetylmuramoyl-L-alanine amidase